MALMPKKTKGVHRWVAIATFPMEESEIMEAKNGMGKGTLTSERLVGVDFGCIDCEEPFGEHSALCTGKEYKGFDR